MNPLDLIAKGIGLAGDVIRLFGKGGKKRPPPGPDVKPITPADLKGK